MSERLAKYNSLVLTEVSVALGELALPGALATATAVETAPDLAHATIWISLLPDSAENWERVAAHRPAIQDHLASRLESKRTPRIELRQDRGPAHAEQVERLLT